MGPAEITSGACRSFGAIVTGKTAAGSTGASSPFASTPPDVPLPPTALKLARSGVAGPAPPPPDLPVPTPTLVSPPPPAPLAAGAPAEFGLPPGDPSPGLLGAMAIAP